MNVEKISAFSYNNTGGNPAGVVFTEEMLSDEQMLSIAKEVNYSETAFLVRQGDAFRIRYFSPQTEIAFCGHATIASGYCLGERYGLNNYELILNNGTIQVDVTQNKGSSFASITSMQTHSKDVSVTYIQNILEQFSLQQSDLDDSFPIRIAFSGNNHLIIFLKNRELLSQMKYDFETTKELMQEEEIVTISLLYREDETTFHSRNAFAYGGVYEDPATGSAAVALGEYLRDTGIKNSGEIEIFQGFDMGQPSHLYVKYSDKANSAVKVSGQSRVIK